METKICPLIIQLVSLCLLLTTVTGVSVDEAQVRYAKLLSKNGTPWKVEEVATVVSDMIAYYEKLDTKSQDEFKNLKLFSLMDIWYNREMNTCSMRSLIEWKKNLRWFDGYDIKNVIDIKVTDVYDSCRDKFRSFLNPISELDLSGPFWTQLSALVRRRSDNEFFLNWLIEQISKESFKTLLETKNPLILGERAGTFELSQAVVDRLVEDVAGIFIPGHCEFITIVQRFWLIWRRKLALIMSQSQTEALNRLTVYCAIKDYKI